nr:hypothetical protein [Tanacetum cinerariifolium]
MMKGSDIGIQEKKAKLFNKWERFTSTDEESIESYYHRFLKLMNDLKRNKHFPEKIARNLKFLNNLQPEWSRYVTIVHQTKHLHTADYTQLYDFLKYNQKEHLIKIYHHSIRISCNNQMTNPEDITDPTTAMNIALALMAKAFKLNYSTPTNNNQRISSNPRNRQIAQPAMNMGQDRQMQMIGGNGGNQFRQNAGNLNGYNAVQNVGNQDAQNLRVHNDGIQNQIGHGNLVAARAEGNAAGLFQAHDRKSKASHQFRLEVYGTVRFGNDHVTAIMGFGDLQWGNILITKVFRSLSITRNIFVLRVSNEKAREHLIHQSLEVPT